MDNNSIWSQTIKGKYFPQSDIINATSPKNHNSSVWKNIYKISRLLRDACFWILGNRKKDQFLERHVDWKYKNPRLCAKHPT